MPEVRRDFRALEGMGVNVLSPPSGLLDAIERGFARVAGDPSRNRKITEDRHLDAIKRADFLWISNPGGYLGNSAAVEFGFALAHRTPVFVKEAFGDDPLDRYVNQAGRPRKAVKMVDGASGMNDTGSSLLFEPNEAIERLREQIDGMEEAIGEDGFPLSRSDANKVLSYVQECRRIFGTAALG